MRPNGEMFSHSILFSQAIRYYYIFELNVSYEFYSITVAAEVFGGQQSFFVGL